MYCPYNQAVCVIDTLTSPALFVRVMVFYIAVWKPIRGLNYSYTALPRSPRLAVDFNGADNASLLATSIFYRATMAPLLRAGHAGTDALIDTGRTLSVQCMPGLAYEPDNRRRARVGGGRIICVELSGDGAGFYGGVTVKWLAGAVNARCIGRPAKATGCTVACNGLCPHAQLTLIYRVDALSSSDKTISIRLNQPTPPFVTRQ